MLEQPSSEEQYVSRFIRLAEELPAVVPYFEEIIERFEELQIDVDDVLALFRIYKSSPLFVYAFLGMMDIIFDMENSGEQAGCNGSAHVAPAG